MQWIIPDNIVDITKEFVRPNMPKGTTHIVFGEGVIIESRAFGRYIGLQAVKIAERVSIGERAFDRCIGLTAVKIAERVHVGRSAFDSCTRLQAVEIAGC